MNTKPWSHRLPVWGKYAVTLLSALVYALIGTFVHRAGADYVPYGMVLALLIIGFSAFSARARLGRCGLLAHIVIAASTSWALALLRFDNAILVPAGFTADLPWMAQHAAFVWLYGVIIVQAVQLVMPARWFVINH